MPSGNVPPQAQGSNAADPDNAEAEARRQENPVEPPAPEASRREGDMANYVEPPVIMESLCDDNEPHSNGHRNDEQVSAPQPDLGPQALSVNPPIQLMVRSDLQNRADARVSSLSVEVVIPRAGHVYAPSLVMSDEEYPVQAAVPDPAPVPAPAPALVPAPAPGPVQTPPPAPAPGPVQTPPPAPAVTANLEAKQDNSTTDPVEEEVSSLSSETSTTGSSESSDEDNLPLSFYNRGPFPKNGALFMGPTGRLAPGSTGRPYMGQHSHLRPVPIAPPPRAMPPADDWMTDDESSDSGTEASSSKRRRQMNRRE